MAGRARTGANTASAAATEVVSTVAPVDPVAAVDPVEAVTVPAPSAVAPTATMVGAAETVPDTGVLAALIASGHLSGPVEDVNAAPAFVPPVPGPVEVPGLGSIDVGGLNVAGMPPRERPDTLPNLAEVPGQFVDVESARAVAEAERIDALGALMQTVPGDPTPAGFTTPGPVFIQTTPTGRFRDLAPGEPVYMVTCSQYLAPSGAGWVNNGRGDCVSIKMSDQVTNGLRDGYLAGPIPRDDDTPADGE